MVRTKKINLHDMAPSKCCVAEYELIKEVRWEGYGQFRRCSGCSGDIHHDWDRCPHCGGRRVK